MAETMLRPAAKYATTSSSSRPSICIIGAGPGGIAMAIELKKHGIDDFVVLEHADGPGGTWRHNVYPGAACDVQSQLYSYSFRLKHDWSRINATQPEILAYLEDVVREFDVERHCRFGCGVTALRWDEDDHAWDVTTATGSSERFRVVISCVGLLNDPNPPRWPGMEAFEGTLMHTARWQPQDLSGRSVAVVGTGSSSAQIVKSIAPLVEKLIVYQREPGWVIPNDDRQIPASEMEEIRRNPLRQRWNRWKIYWQREMAATVVSPGTKVHRARTAVAEKWLETCVADPELRRALTPDYPFNCKRPVRDPDYLRTFNRDNVELVPQAVVRLTRDGVVAADGSERKVDAIVLATGFKASDFLSTLKVIGRDGIELHEAWARKGGPEAFFGLATEGFPNLFMLYGPNSNSATGSIIFVLETQARYVRRAVVAMRRRDVSSIEVRPGVHRLYNTRMQRKASTTTWTRGCHNYYTTSSGKVVTNWPYSAVHYWLGLELFRPDLPFVFKMRRLERSRRTAIGGGAIAGRT